jgi:hypothetical protein
MVDKVGTGAHAEPTLVRYKGKRYLENLPGMNEVS